MIEVIGNTPVNVVAINAIGKITGEDYETTLIPAINAALAASDKIRILYHFGQEYEGFKPEAMWDDARIGMKHYTHYERIAIVSDDESLVHMIKAFGFMIPGEIQVFTNVQLDDALTWVAS